MEQPSRFGYIDTLRGISALGVIVSHMAHRFAADAPEYIWPFEQPAVWFLDGFFDLGRFGVVVFFCVSGFLIPISLNAKRVNPLLRFVISRIFRLYPAYWISIVAALAVIYWPFAKQISPIDTLLNFTMLQQFVGAPNIQGLYWTLQVELIFYALCVMVFVTGRLHNVKALFLIAGALLIASVAMSVARFATGLKLPVGLPLSLSIMFWAYVWRIYLLERQERYNILAIVYLGAFAICLPIICVLSYSKDYGFNETWYSYLIAYSSGIFFFAFFTKVYQIRSAFGEFLGRISYSLYLFGTVAIVTEMTLVNWISLPASVHLLIAICFAIGISAIIYELVEKPAVALGKWVSDSSQKTGLAERMRPATEKLDR